MHQLAVIAPVFLAAWLLGLAQYNVAPSCGAGLSNRWTGTAWTCEAVDRVSPGTPSLGNCGSGPSLGAGSTDAWGAITIGTGIVTTCTLNFSKTLSAAPACTVSSNSVAVQTAMTTVTANSFTMSTSASIGGGVIYYHCPGAW